MIAIRKKILQTVGASALLVLFASGAQAAAIPLANPGFEDVDASGGDVFGAPGWTDFGGGTFTTAAIAARTGTNSFKVFGTSGAFQSFAATAGDVFTMSGFGKNSSTDPILNSSRILLQIAFFDAFGNPAGTAAGGNPAPGFNLFDSNDLTATTPQDIWTEMGVGTAPAPDNTAEARFIVLGLLGSGGAGFFDDVSATVVPVPAAVWLFGSGLIGLIGIARRRRV